MNTVEVRYKGAVYVVTLYLVGYMITVVSLCGRNEWYNDWWTMNEKHFFVG